MCNPIVKQLAVHHKGNAKRTLRQHAVVTRKIKGT